MELKPDPLRKYWYIAYPCPGTTAGFGIDATTAAAWSMQASSAYEDGPYVVLYAEEISKDQYNFIKGYLV